MRQAPNAQEAATRRVRGLVGLTRRPMGAQGGRPSAVGRSSWRLVSAIFLVLLVMTVTVGLAARFDALTALLAGLLIAFGVVAGIRWPSLLLYAYAASIPFNSVVPTGPVGTVARVIGVVFVVGYLTRRLRVLRPGVVPIVLWAFVGWLLASSLWAIDPATSFSAWLSLAQLAAITVLIASIVAEDAAEVGRVLWVYALSAVVTALLGIAPYLTNPAIYLPRATAFQFEDAALFASTLVPAIVYLTYRIVGPGTKALVRAMSAAGASACIVAVALSGTRSAWIGLVAAAITWAVLRPSRRLALGFGTLAAAIAALVVLLPGAGDFLLNRAVSAAADGGAGRTDIWAVGYTIFTSSPVGGVGFANFPLAFTQRVIDQSFVSFVSSDATPGRAPHNVLLGMLVETGIIGTTLFVATMLTVILRMGRAGRGIVVQIGLVSLLVQSLFLDILLQKQLWLLLALAMGLAAGRASELGGVRTRWEREGPAPDHPPPVAVPGLPAAVEVFGPR